jgi:hypothetical protein
VRGNAVQRKAQPDALTWTIMSETPVRTLHNIPPFEALDDVWRHAEVELVT